MKKVIFAIAGLFIFFIVMTAAGEIILRIEGFKPFVPAAPPGFSIEPGGKLLMPDETLGYKNIPGKFKVIFKDSSGEHPDYIVEQIIGDDNLRITHPPDRKSRPGTPPIWIFGCSFTFGWSVNDNGTYPWLLQSELPNYDVVNFSSIGYGTLHFLLMYKDALAKREKPAVIVVTYASFHDMRNVFSSYRRLRVLPWEKLGPLEQPYAVMKNGRLVIHRAYTAVPMLPLLEHSSLAFKLYSFYSAHIEPSILKQRDITKELFLEIRDVSAENGVKMVVAGVYDDQDTRDFLKWCESQGMPAVDISVPNGDVSLTNMPYDAHPSAKAHKIFADKLFRFLTTRGFVAK